MATSLATPAPAVQVEQLAHRFGLREALGGISFEVATGEIFGLLGPNGGGKSTLFRILSTLLPVQRGQVQVLGYDVVSQQAAVRAGIGVTFQSPSLDRRLTVYENLKHQGHLYGLYGNRLRERIAAILNQLGIADRSGDRAESLSGGLQRRVEIAKCLLHAPQLLLLDEPSTGLDPGARLDLWQHLAALRAESGVTVVVTTHLMDEAERCDRLGLLHAGRLVALGTPDELRQGVGGDCITVGCTQPGVLAAEIASRFGMTPQSVGGQLRLQTDRGHLLLRELVDALGDRMTSIALARPTLEDVFVQRTGRRIEDQEDT